MGQWLTNPPNRVVLAAKTNGMFTYFRDKAARSKGGPFAACRHRKDA